MRQVVLSVLAGIGGALLVALLLSPKGCDDTDPPICYSAFGYSVPAGGWWIVAALSTGLLVGWAVSLVVHRTPRIR